VLDNSFATEPFRWNPQAEFMQRLLPMCTLDWRVPSASAFAAIEELLVTRRSQTVHAGFRDLTANGFTASPHRRLSA
jgi:hypothetical protein